MVENGPLAEPGDHPAEAADPDGETWTSILSCVTVVQDPHVICKLLQVSRGFAAAVHAQLAGRLSAQLKASSLTRAQQFTGWVVRNSTILHKISISLTDTGPSPWKCSQAAAAAADARAAALSTGLEWLAGTPPPAAAAAAQASAAAAAAAVVTGVRAFSAHGVPASSACSLAATLSGVASQLTHLELGMLLLVQPEDASEVPAPVVSNPDGLAALAGMKALHTLLLHQPCRMQSGLAGCSWPPLEDCLQWCVSGMAQLTRLELPVHLDDLGSFELLQWLPAGLRQLQLGADADVEGDEGDMAFNVHEAEQVLQDRRRQPLQLSHLAALTKLQLSAVVPLLSCDELPASLLELRLRQCFGVQPLLQLSKLETLSFRPSTIPADRLLALTQLTSLTAVKLFYEGGYQLSGTHTHWSCERVAEHAAVWVKLPLISLGLYDARGRLILGHLTGSGRS
ncbi:hypothetical protein COO60DRAFT_734733 [Scenedesmus sp. NREL 46B-D3]|nr:hypothetical protein COO60DRAFT_734733 [Scenedesmus sp. NREL 46B-D3]